MQYFDMNSSDIGKQKILQFEFTINLMINRYYYITFTYNDESIHHTKKT